jgi:hypothetical protein
MIADCLVADSNLKPTTAIKRTLGSKDPSKIRRFQVKWKAQGSALLSEARQRSEIRRANRSAPSAFDFRRFLGITPEMDAAMRRASELMSAAATRTTPDLWRFLGVGADMRVAVDRLTGVSKAATAAMDQLRMPAVSAFDLRRFLGVSADMRVAVDRLTGVSKAATAAMDQLRMPAVSAFDLRRFLGVSAETQAAMDRLTGVCRRRRRRQWIG